MMNPEDTNTLANDIAASVSVWRGTAAVTGHAADWLVSERLMTPDIRRSFSDPLSIDVLAERYQPLPVDIAALVSRDHQRAWVREIEMRAGQHLLVHAICFAPQETCNKHPWLMTLRDRPLGATLATLDDVQRLDMSFCRSSELSGPLVSSLDGWARRSVFRLQGEPLVLIEHLSETLLGHPRLTAND